MARLLSSIGAAAVIHVLLLAAVFDVYFRSPLAGRGGADLPTVPRPPLPSPAKRLVLIVADGLRAQAFFSGDAPYLKEIGHTRGAWGVSSTHIPTESRPGHVALIAGFYEDPSAIARGWKENPVEFDSIFNRSRYTWSWGSPDILPMFSKGAKGDRVYTKYYSHEEEDFSGKVSTTKLDTWVFDHVEQFLKNAKYNEKMSRKLREDKIVFFLHLLGLDTAGHSHKPNSPEYRENIRVVDEGVTKVEKLIKDFYGDENTAYIFTADHGMTDWGSHGAGSDHETKTPFIAWGAGIKHEQSDDYDAIINDFKYPKHREIEQADICPLMAALIGIDIPVDSVGTTPDRFLNASSETVAAIMYKNMRQILTQYNRKRQMIENSAIKMIYKPYEPLTESKISDLIDFMETMINNRKFDSLIAKSKDIIELSLGGLDYYQNYYQNVLLFALTVSFLGWIFWLFTVLLKDSASIEKNFNKHSTSNNFSINLTFGLITSAIIALIYVQDMPIQYYIYFLLPDLLWWKVILSYKLWYNFFRGLNEKFQSSYAISSFKLLFMAFTYILGTVLLTWSFFQRWALSIVLIGVVVFPFRLKNRRNLPTILLLAWTLTCLLLAGFSFLPVVGNEHNIHLVGVSGLVCFFSTLIFAFQYSLKMLKSGNETKTENIIAIVPAIMMMTALQNKYFVHFQLDNKNFLTTLSQLLSWILGMLSFIVPLFSSKWVISRLYLINSSLAVLFILLSVSHEGFFFVVLVANLFCWLWIEHDTSNHRGAKLTQWSFTYQNKTLNFNKPMIIERVLNSDDFRRAYMLLFYIILSFFGTGNIASINSFDPQWVKCFVTQFSPFTMMALILTKTLIPFLSIVCIFCAVNLVVKAPTGHLFLIMLIYSDMMSLYFLFSVTNKGSWLDIGTSLSHYVIMETIVFFVSILYGVGRLLTSVSFFSRGKDRLKKI